MDIIELFVIGLIPILTGSFGAYLVGSFMLKKVKAEIPDLILESFDVITPELPKILAKEEVRQFVYSLGVLAGNGAKSGALGSMGKGKFKFENLLAEFAPQVIGQILPTIFPGMQQQQGEQPQPQQQQNRQVDVWK